MRRDGNSTSRSIALLLLIVGVSRAMALNIDDLRITKQGRAYQVQMTFGVAASVDQVMAVLTDYGFPDRLDPEVTKREVISRNGGVTRVRTEVRACAVLFCKDVVLTQDITAVADAIDAHIVPDESDFRSGHFHWSVLRSDSGGSHINFEVTMEPDFFIPPLIGGYLVRRKLRLKILTAVENLESEAALASPPVTNSE